MKTNVDTSIKQIASVLLQCMKDDAILIQLTAEDIEVLTTLEKTNIESALELLKNVRDAYESEKALKNQAFFYILEHGLFDSFHEYCKQNKVESYKHLLG